MRPDFERRVYPGQGLDLTFAVRSIYTLRVPLFARFDSGIQKNEDMGDVVQYPVDFLADFPIGRDEAHDDDRAPFRQESGEFGRSPEIFGAIRLAETEILIDRAPNRVAVQNDRKTTPLVEMPIEGVGDRRLPTPAEAVEPDDSTLLAEEFFVVHIGDRIFEWLENVVLHKKSPAPTVWFVRGSITITDPVVRFSS